MMWVWLALFAMACDGLFAGVETGAYRLNRIRLRRRSEEGRGDARRLSRLLRNPQDFVCMTLAGTNISVYTVTAITTWLIEPHSGRYAEMIATLALSPVLFIFAEALPKSLFQAYANTLMYRLSRVLRLAHALLLPVSWPLRGVTRVVNRLAGAPSAPGWELSLERLFSFFTEGAREGVLSAHQDAMVRNVARLNTTPARQIMVPLDRVATVSVDADREEMRRALASRPHTRVPVYEGEPDRLVGVVNLIGLLSADPPATVAETMRPIPHVSGDAPVDDVFREMQRRRHMMCAIDDADGKTVGVLTMKDLVEEVVGDIHGWVET